MQLQRQDNDVPYYLEGLNESQQQAVKNIDGPLLVLAGAGTGKTRVLTTRLAHILQSGKAVPAQILAVTFTNKAAQEMKQRVSSLLGNAPVEGWWLGTFHSLAARMLRVHADLVGLSSNFTIIDPDDQIRLLKPILETLNIDTKKWPPKQVIAVIDRWKDKGLLPEDIKPSECGDMAQGHMQLIYRQYQSRLKEVNACDFGDLLLHMITILKNPENEAVLSDYQRRFKYIMVDEYQDTNVAQYLWLRLLAKGSGNICCVGDDDQSIYGWRGAEVGNILRFEKDFPGANIIRLEQNYRSTGHILAAADGVISHNQDRLGKTLWSDSEHGEKVVVRGLWDGEAEARWVGEEIESLQCKGLDLDEMAVLVRAGFQTREFEERFIQLGIPYKVIGGQRFYERLEIRDALAYFRIIVQSADDLALERIINTPRRGIGDATVQTLYGFARAKSLSLHDAIKALIDTDELRPKVKTALAALIGDIERWRSLLGTMPHTEIAACVLDESGYMQMWQSDKNPDSPGRVENLKELVTGMAEFESMQDFLEHVALVLENQDSEFGQHVSIMTLHAAKGLEFDAVFLPGFEEGLFPSQRTMDENGIKGLEEERRLAYVGITRAKKRSYISYAANRRMYGNWINAIPSRFVDELPQEHIDIIADGGLYGAGRSSHWDSSGFVPKKTAAGPGRVMSGNGEIFSRGDRVFHDKFGAGTIVNIDGHKLDIAFDRSGQKRVMDSLALLRKKKIFKMSNSYKIATVFGATGFLGRNIVSVLAKKGYRIKAATRVPEKAYFLKPYGAVGQIVPVYCNYNSEDSVMAVVEGSDIVVNCIGILYQRGKEGFKKVHVDTPDMIAKACKKHKVDRFVHVSALGVDEAPSKYARTKKEGEKAVKKAFPRATILRPSVIFGPGDSFFNMFAEMARYLPFLPLIGGGHTKFSPVYVGDVVAAAMAAIEKPDLGEDSPCSNIYELAGPETLTFKEIYERLFFYTRRPRPLISIPFGLAKFQAFFMGLLPKPPLTCDQVESLKSDNIMSPKAKGLEDLDVKPTGMDLILPEYLETYCPGGHYDDQKPA
jgi:DNA helicase-2/ATP-dependent DNA helicase PcrA